MDITINKQAKFIANVTSGGPITTFEWKLDDIPQINNINILTIEPYQLSLGNHTIKFRGQNYCGNYSQEIIEQVNIVGDIMEKTEQVTVDQPTVELLIVMPYVGTINVTVTQPLNGVPIANVALDLDGISTGLTTGADGKASIPNVPYGNHTVRGVEA